MCYTSESFISKLMMLRTFGWVHLICFDLDETWRIVVFAVLISRKRETETACNNFSGWKSVPMKSGLLSGKVCGLCGNADGVPENDLVTKFGVETDSHAEIGDSWLAPNSS